MARFPGLLVGLLTLLTAACGGKDADSSASVSGAGPVKVATSISVLGDMVRQVGGDRVMVISLIPPGADAHTFQPAPKDVKKLGDVRAVFINGAHLEESLEGVLSNNVPKTARVVAVSEGIPAIVFAEVAVGQGGKSEDDEHDDGGNPHFWLDVQNAKRYVQVIRDTLIQVDSEGKDTYAANTDRYLKELDELDAYIRAQIETIPREQRKLVTFHDAFPYFARAYGLELTGYVVRSPGREPSAQEIKTLSDTLRRQNVRAVFKEPQLNARLLERAAKDAGVKVESLYSDALTKDITSYVQMMRVNADTVARGLR
jgi:manganese/iron transport system substrate-binding protein